MRGKGVEHDVPRFLSWTTAEGAGFTLGCAACAGAGWANHAAVNVVPRNLVTRLPDEVPFAQASLQGLLDYYAIKGQEGRPQMEPSIMATGASPMI